ncbi:MAG TPA: hypothetical protein VHB21_20470, partial [Minicystis sp.]|nr:hypothetical protein [Minicystis sp.]
MDTTKLEPLLCPGCGAPVPLEDADALRCPFCGANVPVPASYRALVAGRRLAEADRARLRAAYAALGAPPGLLLRFWARSARATLWIVRWWTLVPLFVAAEFFVSFPLPRLFARAAPRWGFCLVDVLGPTLYMLACTLTFVALVLLPQILLRYRGRVASCRGALAANMAARPPATPGGPATCNECGAPLGVAAGELGVRCAYCGTDNLVALPPEFVQRMASANVMRHADATEALAAAAVETAAAR